LLQKFINLLIQSPYSPKKIARKGCMNERIGFCKYRYESSIKFSYHAKKANKADNREKQGDKRE
jgi:hypothetical protein